MHTCGAVGGTQTPSGEENIYTPLCLHGKVQGERQRTDGLDTRQLLSDPGGKSSVVRVLAPCMPISDTSARRDCCEPRRSCSRWLCCPSRTPWLVIAIRRGSGGDDAAAAAGSILWSFHSVMTWCVHRPKCNNSVYLQR